MKVETAVSRDAMCHYESCNRSVHDCNGSKGVMRFLGMRTKPRLRGLDENSHLKRLHLLYPKIYVIVQQRRGKGLIKSHEFLINKAYSQNTRTRESSVTDWSRAARPECAVWSQIIPAEF